MWLPGGAGGGGDFVPQGTDGGQSWPGGREPSLLCVPESPPHFLALSASQTPVGNPRACQGGPGCLSGFSSLGKKPLYTPLRHPQPWPRDGRGVSTCKGSWAPGRETGVCILGTAFRVRDVAWAPASRVAEDLGVSPPFKSWHQGAWLLQ